MTQLDRIVIQTDGLSKSYGEIRALKPLDL